jgi:DNA-directed RNA polymerase specialized sigma24 family protein
LPVDETEFSRVAFMDATRLGGAPISEGSETVWSAARAKRVNAAKAPRAPLWPGRIRELAARCRQPLDALEKERLVAELWKLIGLALHKYVLLQTGRLGRLTADDIADVTSEKALELLRRLDGRQWDPTQSTDAQLCSFIAAVARHGVVDLLRRRRREARAASWFRWKAESQPVEPESSIDACRYARAVVDCAARLTARARWAWALRSFGGLPAADIARHPAIRSTTAGVDVMLSRSRRHLRECLESRNLDPACPPPGTFVALWEMLDRARGADDAQAGEPQE